MQSVPSPYLITAPTDAVVTLDEIKAHLRVDHSDDDLTIQNIINEVVGEIDPAGSGWLGRALRTQTWEIRFSGFWPSGASFSHNSNHRFGCDMFGRITLPFPPLKSVTSIKYDDAGGVERTMVVNTDYRVFGVGQFNKGYVAPAYNKIWPPARYDLESIRIRFICGYDLTPSDLLPERIKTWVKLVIGSLYENRESVIVGTRAQIAQLPDHLLNSIYAYRVYS